MTKAIVVNESITEQFAKWFYQETEGGKTIGVTKIQSMLSRIRPGYQFDENDARKYVSLASAYWEEHFTDTVINIRGEGWTRSSNKQLEDKYGKVCNLTAQTIQRALRLRMVCEARGIDFESAKREFMRMFSKKLESMSPSAQRYHQTWIKLVLDQRKKQELITNGK